MASLDDLLQPIDIFLFEHPSDGEKVQHAAVRFDALACLDGVLLRLGVEIPFLVIPVRRFPRWEIAAHLQIERDSDEGLLLIGCQAFRVFAGDGSAGEPPSPNRH